MVTKNKTPAEVEAVTITMSRETAQAVKQACEEYLRFRMGQFEDFTNEVCCWDYVDKMEKRCHTTEERKQFHKDHEADFLKCMRLRNQMRQGILLFSPAGRVVSRCFVRFRAASFPDPGDNAHCRRRG